jgi:hypothetical protein
MGRVEVFDGFEFEARAFDFPFEAGQFVERPKLVGIAGQAPPLIVADGLIAGTVGAGGAEVIDQMDDQMGAAALARETEMLVIQLMPVEAEAEFHKFKEFDF